MNKDTQRVWFGELSNVVNDVNKYVYLFATAAAAPMGQWRWRWRRWTKDRELPDSKIPTDRGEKFFDIITGFRTSLNVGSI